MNRMTKTLWTSTVTVLLAGILAACGSTATSTSSAVTANTQPSTAAVTAPSTPASVTATEATTSASAATSAAATTTTSSAAAATTAPKLNVNTLTEAQLAATIPNFPTRMGREFLEYRPWISIQQFRKELGKYVSADQIAAWEPYVYVPVDLNTSDAATVQQLPGVDASVAAALIAGRPYASNDAFLTKLAEHVSADQLALAKSYLVTK